MKSGTLQSPRAPASCSERQMLGMQAQRIDHDLRTPLGTLTTALDLLYVTADGGAIMDAETRQVMRQEVARLTALVDELRVLASALVGCEDR